MQWIKLLDDGERLEQHQRDKKQVIEEPVFLLNELTKNVQKK